MLRKEKEKASASVVSLDLKHYILLKLQWNLIPLDTWTHNPESLEEEETHTGMLYPSLIPWLHILMIRIYAWENSQIAHW